MKTEVCWFNNTSFVCKLESSRTMTQVKKKAPGRLFCSPDVSTHVCPCSGVSPPVHADGRWTSPTFKVCTKNWSQSHMFQRLQTEKCFKDEGEVSLSLPLVSILVTSLLLSFPWLQFRGRIQDVLPQLPAQDDHFLLRWLRGQLRNVKKMNKTPAGFSHKRSVLCLSPLC